MTEKLPLSHPLYDVLPTDVAGFDSLAELALNICWSWDHCADQLWKQLDPVLWELTHNPWGILQTASREKLEAVLANPEFRQLMNSILTTRQKTSQSTKWFQQNYPKSPLTCVAYFSMEFMLSEALPIYSGGLGNVAGDQLKAASDLGVPVVAIGLLYQQGYFRQLIDKNGAQLALFPYNDPGQLPITPLRQKNGEWLRIRLDLPGHSVWLRCWQVQVGAVKLYLLDANDAANFPAYRGITNELYGGDGELRLMQELVLGIGGWRLLEALNLKPEVCHLNEGHAAFAILDRARSFMEQTGKSFAVALAATRAGNLFTTHTAVSAGFDRFAPALIEKHLSRYVQDQLGISIQDLLALGRQDPGNPNEDFNMAYLAIRGSGAVNGVSRLHGNVSQHLFATLFSRWPIAEVPVGYITNGVHMPSWDSPAADHLWTEACNKQRWLGSMDQLEKKIRLISDEKMWEFRMRTKEYFISDVRRRLALQLAASGATPEAVAAAKQMFDPNVLTVGFARRFATYKRPNLLLHDQQRLLYLLNNSERPLQIILAGKAHPADLAGQALIQQWQQFIHRPDVRPHIIFLADYDVLLAEQLVQGVDIWLNTPERPWEASGTSGMKVLVNGGINISELDGWWAEAYSPEVGWALGDGKEHGDDPAWNAQEANALYDLLEREVIPEFYTRNNNNIPTAWVARMRASMARLTPRFSTNRVIREYLDNYYIPAAIAYKKRAENKGALAAELVSWNNTLSQKWDSLHFSNLRVQSSQQSHDYSVDVYFADLDPQWVQVELYANGLNDSAPVRVSMKSTQQLLDVNSYVYSAQVPADRPVTDYTVRLIGRHDEAAIPLEATHILWQR